MTQCTPSSAKSKGDSQRYNNTAPAATCCNVLYASSSCSYVAPHVSASSSDARVLTSSGSLLPLALEIPFSPRAWEWERTLSSTLLGGCCAGDCVSERARCGGWGKMYGLRTFCLGCELQMMRVTGLVRDFGRMCVLGCLNRAES